MRFRISVFIKAKVTKKIQEKYSIIMQEPIEKNKKRE
jgi:hypothetical protein